MVSSLATTETSSFSHVSGTIIGRESRSNLRYFSFHLHGRLLIWIGGVTVPGERDHGPLGYSGSVQDQLQVFLTGFAIEEARRKGMVIDCEEFTSRALDTYCTGKGIDQTAQPKVAIEMISLPSSSG